MTFVQFMRQWDHLPMSRERLCQPISNGELRRMAEQRSVLVNGQAVDIEMPCQVTSLVLWPKSAAHRTTWI